MTQCIGVFTDSIVVVTSVLLLFINVLILCHHIAFICTARVINHQHRLHHGSGGCLLASNHGSRGSIPGQFMLICDGEIAIFFSQYFCFPHLHYSTSAPWSDFISSWYCVTLVIGTIIKSNTDPFFCYWGIMRLKT